MVPSADVPISHALRPDTACFVPQYEHSGAGVGLGVGGGGVGGGVGAAAAFPETPPAFPPPGQVGWSQV